MALDTTVGAFMGCGIGAPIGSVIGLTVATACGGIPLYGLFSGASVGGVVGGFFGAGVGAGLGIYGTRLSLSLAGQERLGASALTRMPFEQVADQALNRLPFRGRLLTFLLGLMLGSGSLTAIVLQWRRDATIGIIEASGEEKGARLVEDPVLQHGKLFRWVWFSPWWWVPHWQRMDAQLRPGLLLMTPGSDIAVATRELPGHAVALSLAGAHVHQTSHHLEVRLASGWREFLRPASSALLDQWCDGLSGNTTHRRRVVSVDFPHNWEGPADCFKIVSLHPQSPEYQDVVRRVEMGEQLGGMRQQTYVKGKLNVTRIARVQSPHVWDQYCMRRAIIAAENEGEPNERFLWHGTTSMGTILSQGFDPRVCSLGGMFGGGVYFADKPRKSVRYCGSTVQGKLLLCRVSLGRRVLKRISHSNLRRPPDPLPIFPTHVSAWAYGQRFHSVFYSANHFPWLLAMNEYIVYHTNQAYPEYIVHFVME